MPVVPGSEGLIEKDEDALRLADAMGYPVLIKAAAGGGGRGMRVARNDMTLQAGLKVRPPGSRKRLQGRQRLPRKIHRTAAPHRGANARRPARQRRPPVGTRLFFAAPPSETGRGIAGAEPAGQGARPTCATPPCDWSRSAGYYNAGTCEFLVDKQNRFYFIEVNARIQVEHPVTELVTGIDLVKAADPYRGRRAVAVHAERHRPSAAAPSSAASTPRIPADNFRPSPGLITRWQPPGGPGVRLDTHVVAGYRVPPNYDSLVAKLLVYQPTRTRRWRACGERWTEFIVEGIKTTIPIHREIFDHAAFVEGQVDTTFIERTWHKG